MRQCLAVTDCIKLPAFTNRSFLDLNQFNTIYIFFLYLDCHGVVIKLKNIYKCLKTKHENYAVFDTFFQSSRTLNTIYISQYLQGLNFDVRS